MQHTQRIRILFIWFLSLGVGLVSYRFMLLGLETAFPEPAMLAHITDRKVFFILHVVASPLALIFGLFQFWAQLRTKAPRVHWWIGRIYVLSVLIGGGAGLVMAFGSVFDRPSVGYGFILLSVAWVGVTLRAIYLAMTGQFAKHRDWMFRSYALTFAAVTLRLWLLLFALSGMSYAEASSYLAWLCWVPNVVLAEFYLRYLRKPSLLPSRG